MDSNPIVEENPDPIPTSFQKTDPDPAKSIISGSATPNSKDVDSSIVVDGFDS